VVGGSVTAAVLISMTLFLLVTAFLLAGGGAP
jgi:hypothetical protein